MSSTTNWPDWPVPSKTVLEQARDIALTACSWAATPNDRPAPVSRYYSEDGYAGTLFGSIEPNHPNDIGASDLLATTMLSVKVTTNATRRLLLPGEARDRVLTALTAVPASATITEASAENWLAAEDLYRTTRSTLGRRPWVTASKLVARKRPALLPVRDNVVVNLLRPGQGADYQQDWYVIRHLMLDDQVVSALGQLRTIADTVGPDRSEDHGLRLLDVALWMYGMGTDARAST